MDIKSQVEQWVDESAKLCKPMEVVYIDGSEEQANRLAAEALKTGELIKLNEEFLPGCYLHRSHVNDVARVEHRTYICSETEEEAGPNNNWLPPKEAYERLNKLYDHCMVGRTMYVIPFLMGPYGSPYSRVGVEITDSIYVVLSMRIMARVGERVWSEMEEKGHWVRCMHSVATLDPDERYICHFPQDNTVLSINSGYGGNALMGKKCYALRMASCLGRKEGWLAEHMLIVCIEYPNGEKKYIAGAFPSACGKTNLAMLVPPELYRAKGYKVYCVGDDIAWMHIGKDGRLYAINAEKGFFGVVPGTNNKTNPNAMDTIKSGTIYTNVVQDLDNNTVWWERKGDEPPKNGLDWKGQPFSGEGVGAHPNSRFTAPIENCPILSPNYEDAEGVPISAIVFGGRRAKLAPLVYQSTDWQHGVFVGSILASETTAANIGQVGVVRRDPMAMLPFCGYNMGDYFQHWLEMGEKLGDKAPLIFHINWFRQDENGKYIWPGFGDNMRVLLWMLDRCDGTANAKTTPIGYTPSFGSIYLHGVDISGEQFDELLKVDADLWQEEVANIEEFYAKFGDKMPSKMHDELSNLKKRLAKSKE